MANTIYEPFVIEKQLTSTLTTMLNARAYMNIDNTLVGEEGTTKKIKTRTISSSVEEVAQGATNATRGSITDVVTPYEVVYSQAVYDIFDEELNQDGSLIDDVIKSAGEAMTNDMIAKFFAELDKGSLSETYTKDGSMGYADVVSALDKMDLENEDELVLFVSSEVRTMIRNDEDFKAANQGELLFSGMIGRIAGIPVVHSKAITAGKAYLASTKAVTLFVKNDSYVGTDRSNELRKTVYTFGKLHLCAIKDATKVCVITEALA